MTGRADIRGAKSRFGRFEPKKSSLLTDIDKMVGTKKRKRNKKRISTHNDGRAYKCQVGEEISRLSKTWRVKLKARSIRPHCSSSSA